MHARFDVSLAVPAGHAEQEGEAAAEMKPVLHWTGGCPAWAQAHPAGQGMQAWSPVAFA